MVMAAALPLALHPNPARVANIGFGSGLTSHVLLASDVVSDVDIDRDRTVHGRGGRSSASCRALPATFDDPRSHIYFEDAKTFFAVHKKKYDVIVSEPSNPWVSGVSSLFSDEFYSQITRYLEPDGMLVQWIQIYETDLDIVLSVIKALAPHFEDFAIYNADDTNLLIVAARSGTLPRPDARLFASEAMRAELAKVGIDSAQNIEARYLGNKRLLLPLLASSGVPANSDYFPYVDLNAGRARILKRNAAQFAALGTLPVPFFELLTGAQSSRERTYFSPNAFSSRDSLVGQALALRDAWETSQYDGLTPEAARAFLTLYTGKEQCRNEAVRRAWLDSVAYIGARTSTVLASKELKVIWDKIEASPCASELTAQERGMLDLFRATAMRDARGVAKAGSELFASDPKLMQSTCLPSCLIATAASQIATGQPTDALALIAKNSNEAPQTASQALALRWLAAIAVSQVRDAEALAAKGR